MVRRTGTAALGMTRSKANVASILALWGVVGLRHVERYRKLAATSVLKRS